jgi:aminoglycoside phosphotransferase
MIKIVGNSGCPVEIIQNDSGLPFVRKSCSIESSSRLIQQIKKQIDFQHESIKSPHVIRQFTDNDRYFAEMQYVRSLDFVTFTGTSTNESYERVCSSIVDFVKDEFMKSTIEKFPAESWNVKVSEVCKKVFDQRKISYETLNEIKSFLLSDLPEEILVGKCHGDLTLSNVLISESNEVFFIDFLNPPIESPYEDVAKILQDTTHQWSVHHFSGSCDRSGIAIRWNHFENLLFERLKSLIDMHTLKKIQVLSLLRIVPYTEKSHILRFLTDSILKEISIASNITMCR